MADYSFPLKDRREIAEDTVAFWFDTSGAGFTFKAGQDGNFTLIDPPKTDAEGDTRTFSFANSPNDTNSLMIATRMRRTAFKESLKIVPLGTKVKMSGPMGSFTLHNDATKPAVFLAGGIGITPMRAMIQWATEMKLPHKMLLLYSNRTPASTAFLSDFEAWAKENPNFKFVATVTNSAPPSWRYAKGRIDSDALRRYISDVAKPIYYIAGPPGMVAAMRTMLNEIDVNDDNIRTDEFAGY